MKKTRLEDLPTVNDELDEKYGKEGTPTREAFHAEAMAWYYGELLKDARKKAGYTQKEVAEEIGRTAAYVSRVERGIEQVPFPLFIRMCDTVGMQISLTY